jgi:hypothetical protein
MPPDNRFVSPPGALRFTGEYAIVTEEDTQRAEQTFDEIARQLNLKEEKIMTENTEQSLDIELGQKLEKLYDRGIELNGLRIVHSDFLFAVATILRYDNSYIFEYYHKEYPKRFAFQSCSWHELCTPDRKQKIRELINNKFEISKQITKENHERHINKLDAFLETL